MIMIMLPFHAANLPNGIFEWELKTQLQADCNLYLSGDEGMYHVHFVLN